MMDDGQSISRKRKMDDQSGQDLLSDLPLSIIHCILELVPMIDAVRTCILSKQWRYKWVSLPRLVFDHTVECVDQTKSKDIRVTWLKNFITNALFLHQGPIQKFQLSNLILNSCPDTDSWLLHLSRNEIREFRIETKPKNGLFTVHSSIYSCQKLTHLHLFGCKLAPPPPTFNGFSCLRSLFLFILRGPSNAAVQTLFSNSPLLENLTYSNYSDSSEFRIRAPNLKSFKFGGNCKEIALHAPLVTEVSIILFISSKVYCKNSSVCNYSKFLGGFPNLEKLMCHLFSTKYLSIGIESYDRSLVFHHLKIITLFRVNCDDVKEISVPFHLIMSAPNLHEFSFDCVHTSLVGNESSEAHPISFSDFGCTFEKLRIFNIKDVLGLPFEMEFVEYLLKSSPGLEKMNINFSSELKLLPEKILTLKTKLLTYGRASPNAKIFLEKSPLA